MQLRHLRSFICGLLVALCAPGVLGAQVVPDSLRFGVQRDCQLPCIEYRIVLFADGRARIDRSDSVRIELRVDAAESSRIVLGFGATVLDSLPDRVPSKNSDCSMFGDHSPTYSIELYHGAAVRRVVDQHGCAYFDPAGFGASRARAAERLRDIEKVVERLVGIERWLAR